MTPTLIGRIQTRIFLIAVVGTLWTLLVGPFVPGVPDGAGLGDVYELLFKVLAAVLLLGIAWELLYHGLMQWRWEKDWPTLFGFLTGINEGILLWILLEAEAIPWIDGSMPGSTFLFHFATTWLVTWLFAHGPMQVIFFRWRFRGGRLL
jgi:hypothetical protein